MQKSSSTSAAILIQYWHVTDTHRHAMTANICVSIALHGQQLALSITVWAFKRQTNDDGLKRDWERDLGRQQRVVWMAVVWQGTEAQCRCWSSDWSSDMEQTWYHHQHQSTVGHHSSVAEKHYTARQTLPLHRQTDRQTDRQAGSKTLLYTASSKDISIFNLTTNNVHVIPVCTINDRLFQ